MAETIKGINVQIGSDTTGLSKALADVNSKSKGIQSELKKVEQALKFNPKNTELLAQKQKLLGNQVAVTKEKLDRLKAAQSQVNEQFKQGKISEGQYRAFQREIITTGSKLKTFESQLKNTGNRAKEFAEKLKKTKENLGRIGKTLSTNLTAPLLGAGAALTVMTTKASQATDRIDKMSQRLGLSREAFQEWDFILSQNGVSIDSMQMGMKSLSQRMDEVMRGTGQGAELFGRLDKSLISSIQSGESQEEVFKKTVIALQNMDDGITKAALAQKLFGRNGQELLPMLNSSKGSVEELMTKARELGLVLDDETIDAGVGFTDTLDQLKRALGAAATKVGVALMPAFTSLIPIIKDNLVPAVRNFADKIKNLIEWFSNLNPGLQKTIMILTGIAIAAGPVVGAIAAIASPIGLVILAAAGLAAAAYTVYKNWNNIAAFFMTVWDKVVAAVKIAWAGIRIYILTEISLILKGMQMLTGWIPGWGNKLKGAIAGVEKQLHAAVGDMQTNYHTLTQNRYKEHYNWMVNRNKKKNDDIIKQEKEAGNKNTKQIKVTSEAEKKAAEKADEERLNNEKEWHEKLLNETRTELEKINAEEKKALSEADLTGKAKADITKYYELKRTELAKTEAEKRTNLEKEWADKVKNTTISSLDNIVNDEKKTGADRLTASKEALKLRLELLKTNYEKEKTEAEKAKADTTDITKNYNMEKLSLEQKAAVKEDAIRKLALDRAQNYEDRLYEATHTAHENRLKELDDAQAKELEQLNLTEQEKADIVAYYTQQRNALYDEEADIEKQAAQAMASSFVNWLSPITEGTKTFKEALKETLLSFLSMLETQVLAAQLAAEGIAAAMSVWDFGTAWAKLSAALPKIAASLAGFEVLKAGVNAMATGGVVTRPTMALIGEGKSNEAVLPLDQDTYAALAKNIVANMENGGDGGSGLTVNLYAGTVIGDKAGMKKLAREIFGYEYSIKKRLGVATK
jgi:phage-related minor tail protein